MRRTITWMSVVLAAIFGVPALAHDGNHGGYGDGAFAAVLHHYEAVRVALVNDHVEGIAENAEEIRAALAYLAASFTATRAGVQVDKADDARALLPLLAEASSSLASAKDLAATRDAFYDLSKPLVRWRSMATGELPVVAYCSMAKRSWLQPEGALGNPYYGRSMEKCGEVVS